MTRVATQFFAVNLPGEWKENITGNPTLWQYHVAGGSEQLSVTVLQYAKAILENEVQPHMEEYLSVRRKAEYDAANNSKIEITPVTLHAEGPGITASYSGSHLISARRFLNFSIANVNRIVTFYYEGLDMDAVVFERRKREVLGSVQVAS